MTPPTGWRTYEVTFNARVTDDTVTYEVCNESGAMQNFGTAPPVRVLLFR